MTQLTTLALDASTYRGTVAVLRGDEVVAAREVAMRGETEERLMPAVAEALREAGADVAMLDRVVCGNGPGSFTSLRIAASIAKGIASVRGIPLHAVSSLLLAAAGASPALPAGRYLVLMDAMRGERFALEVVVDAEGRVGAAGACARIGEADARRLGAEVESRVLDASASGTPENFAPHARGVARLIRQGSLDAPVSLESWEPDYGRLAEAQVKWEAAHGRALPASGA